MKFTKAKLGILAPDGTTISIEEIPEWLNTQMDIGMIRYDKTKRGAYLFYRDTRKLIKYSKLGLILYTSDGNYMFIPF